MRMSRGGAVVGGVVLAVLLGTGTAVAAPSGVPAGPAPLVSSLSSVSGPLSGHGTLAVHGTGFTGVTSVLFGGAKAGSVHVVSSHVVTLVVPVHPAGRLDVRVVTSHGTSRQSKHDVYTYVAPPSVTAISTGTAAAGVQLTVKGSGFSHVKRVLFGAAAGAHVRVLSSKTLTVAAPAHAAGRVDIKVVTAYGTSRAKAGDRFTYVAPATTPPAPAPAPPAPPVPVVVVVTTAALPTAERGTPYTASIAVSGGTAPYAIAVTGLPEGITASSSGALSGKTFAPAVLYSLTVKATDAVGRIATRNLSLPIREHPGQVFGWGLNGNGQVGNGLTGGHVDSPVALAGLTDVVQVAGGSASGYALKADGTVWDWGDNSKYQLGDGTITAHTSPQQVPGLSGVVALAAGGYTAYALLSDGTLVSWGEDDLGQAGNNSNASPVMTPSPVPFLSRIVQVVAGYSSAYALDASGNVYGWGQNNYGQVGFGRDDVDVDTAAVQLSGLTGIKQLAAKEYDAFALKSDGTVMGWGRNDAGEVGDTTIVQRSAPVPVFGLTGVKAIAAADFDTYALLGDGTVRAWGRNTEGEAGDGTTTQHLSPIAVPSLTGVQSIAAGAYDCYAQHPDGTVSVWGGNGSGEAGDGTTSARTTAGLDPALTDMTDIAAAHQTEFGVR